MALCFGSLTANQAPCGTPSRRTAPQPSLRSAFRRHLISLLLLRCPPDELATAGVRCWPSKLVFSSFHKWGPKTPHERRDPTADDFWNPAFIRPKSQHVGSLCLCGRLGPQCGVELVNGFPRRRPGIRQSIAWPTLARALCVSETLRWRADTLSLTAAFRARRL